MKVRKTNRQRHKHNRNLSDAAMSDFLQILKYKSQWYSNIYECGKEFKSTRTCSACGFINDKINNTSIREWKCPKCGAFHDRDINAAINIRNMTLKQMSN